MSGTMPLLRISSASFPEILQHEDGVHQNEPIVIDGENGQRPIGNKGGGLPDFRFRRGRDFCFHHR
jgi:hypothetical protein